MISYSKFTSIIVDRNGNVAAIFAVLLFPLVFSIGAAVDYSRYQTSIQQLTAAQDTAMKAASRKIRTASVANTRSLRNELDAEFGNFMKANFNEQKNNTEYTYKFSFNASQKTIVMDMTARQNTTFLAMVGKTHFSYHNRVETALAPEGYIGNIAECINATGAMSELRNVMLALEKSSGRKFRMPKRQKFHAGSLEAELAKRLKFQRRSKNARSLCRAAFPKK